MALVPFPQKSVTPAEEPDWENDSESAEGKDVAFLDPSISSGGASSGRSSPSSLLSSACFLDERTYGPIGSHGRGHSIFSVFRLALMQSAARSLARRCSSIQTVGEAFSVTSSWR